MNKLAGRLIALTFVLSPSGLAQELLETLSPPADWESFGYRVALDGPDQLLVSAISQNVGSGFNAGGLHVYQRQAGAWVLEGTMAASDAASDDALGTVIDLSGDLALAANEQQGLYVFERDAAGWSEVDRVWPSSAANGSDPNRAVAIAGESLLLGIYKLNSFSGVTFCFDRTPTGWVEVPGPEPIGGIVASSRFGAALDWDEANGRLAVGAIGNGNAAVYIFERQGPAWAQVGMIPAPTNNGFFGWAIDLDGDKIAIGAPYRNFGFSQVGTVHVYKRTIAGNWQPDSSTLAPSDRQGGEHFGTDVELDGDQLVVGAPNLANGAVYQFRRGPSGWTQTGKQLNPVVSGANHQGFGLSLALEGGTLAIGMRNANPDNVYVYDLPRQVAPYGFCASTAPCSNADAFGGCANSTGNGGHLSSTGSVSLGSDDLQLVAANLPENVTGLMFMGGARISAPLADGFLLVAPGSTGLYRFQPRSTGAMGSLTLGPGIGTLSGSLPPGAQVIAGSTWYFQCYYRDPSGPCGNQANLSNGLQIDFLP